MRSRLIVFLVIAVSLVFGLLVARQMVRSRSLPREQFAEKKVRVLTYSTFVGANGPGPEIFQRFEKSKNVKIDVVRVTDAGLLLERLKVAEASAPVDVVIGLDQLLIDQARSEFQWKPLATDMSAWAKPSRDASSENFAAFDWSPLTFVYRKDSGNVPAKFDDLLKPEFKNQFALQDPRASTPGLQFFHWVKALKGKDTAKWLERFRPNVNSVSPSWSFAYGLFKKGQTRFVFSYVTSLAYHWGFDKDRSFDVLNFPEGHPVQVEFAAVPASCKECELAQDLVKTLHEDWAQTAIMNKNFMFPVKPEVQKGSVYSELPVLKTLSTETGKDLSDWDKVFPR